MHLLFDFGLVAAVLQTAAIALALAIDGASVTLAFGGSVKAWRREVALAGAGAGLAARVLLALAAAPLARVLGGRIVAALLLLWVVWRLWRWATGVAPAAAPRGFARAAAGAAACNAALGLDTVAGIAAVGRAHPWVTGSGLVLAVLLTGLCAAPLGERLARRGWPLALASGGVVWAAVALLLVPGG